MAAIITDDFRRNQARLLVNDIKASASSLFDSPSDNSDETTWPYRGNNRYAIGLGKSDPWPDSDGIAESSNSFAAPVPSGTIQEMDDVMNNLFTLKDVEIGNVKQLIAKNAWESGRKYKIYDTSDNDMFYATGDEYPCVVTNGDKVYVCLSNSALDGYTSAGIASTVAPASTGYSYNQTTTDGYVWAHVVTLTPEKLNTAQYAPIPQLDVAGQVSHVLTGGLLTHIGVTDGGTGYTSAPTVTVTVVDHYGQFIANSTGVTFKAIVENGAVTRVDMTDATASPAAGSNHYWTTDTARAPYIGDGTIASRTAHASVAFSGGGATSQATGYAVILPSTGLASNAIDVLPTWFVGITADFIAGGGTDDDHAAIDFRQVSLLKNVVRNTAEDNSDGTMDTLKYVTLDEATSGSSQETNRAGLAQGHVLYTSTGATMYFDYIDGNNLYYHQNSNDDVNMIRPLADDTLFNASSGQIGDVLSVHKGEYDQFKHAVYGDNDLGPTKKNGEVIFHENRKPFSRGDDQTEEVKLIIQL